MIKKIAPLLIVMALNLWIWKIFSISIPIALVVGGATVLLWLSIATTEKKFFFAAIGIFVVLLFLNYKTSSKNSLTFLNSSEKFHLLERLRAYPPTKISLGSKVLYIPMANWMEQRKETLVFYKLEGNLSEIIDPNLYFFANHPRERVGAKEFEKFPYIMLPLFVIGLLSINRKNAKVFLLASSPFLLYAVIGNSNPMGPLALFPLITVSITLGLALVIPNKKVFIPGIILFILTIIQTISYEKF